MGSRVLGLFVLAAALAATACGGGSERAATREPELQRGLDELVATIAEEERVHGVRANAVAPTSIKTADNVAAMGPDVAMVTREAVADVVLWLCSDAARAVTGQIVAVR